MPGGKRSTRFNITIGVRAPQALVDAIDKGAVRRLMSPTEYIRGAIFDRLVADGIINLEQGAKDGES